MTRSPFLKTKGDPYIVKNNTRTFEDCGVLLEWVVDNELQIAMIAANINILRREAPYAYFFAGGITLEKWSSSRLVQNHPYLKSLNSKQLQQGVWLTVPNLDLDTTTVVTAVLSGDILPLARSMQDAENCLVCLPEVLTLEDIDALFADERGTAGNLEVLLENGGFLLSIVDLRALQVKTYDEHILEYFAS